jgi:hypothetical protein
MAETDSLDPLLQPQRLGIKLAPLSTQLGVTLTSVQELAEINNLFVSKGILSPTQSRRLANAAAYYISSLEGNLKSVEALKRRVQVILNLVRTSDHTALGSH